MYIPSSTGPLRDLNACLRENHERRRAWVLKEIADRKAKGVPLDDSTDFSAFEGRMSAAQAAVAAMDGAALRTSLLDMLKRVSGGLADPGEYEPKPQYEGVSIRIRPLTERQRLELNKGFQATDLLGQNAACREFAAVSIDEVAGIETDGGPALIRAQDGRLPEDMLDLLDRGDMLGDLFVAVKAYHEIDEAKKKRFGCRAPSTSPSSTAPSATQASDDASAATAAAPSTASQSQTTAVLEGTGSNTQRFANGTGSTAPPREGLAPPVSL